MAMQSVVNGIRTGIQISCGHRLLNQWLSLTMMVKVSGTLHSLCLNLGKTTLAEHLKVLNR